MLIWSPYKLKNFSLKNRLVMAPLSTGLATTEGYATPEQVEFYRRRAAGVGLVVLEPGVVEPAGRLFPRSLGIWSDEHAARLRPLVAAVKEQGARIVIQLCHSGMRARAEVAGAVRPSPGSRRFYFDEPVHPLQRDELAGLKGLFVAAARRAVTAGFDGVEVHAAHFYLLSSFLSPLTNDRTDEYGQTAAGRARLVAEIISSIKQEIGDKYLVGVRYNTREPEGGIDGELAREYGQIFASAGADYLSLSAFITSVPALKGKALVAATSAPTADFAPGCYRPWVREVKEAVTVPVVGVGRLDDLQQAEEALVCGDCDLVAVGRAFIADPDWAKKVQQGLEPRHCRFCNYCLGCLARGSVICIQDKEAREK